MKGDNALAKIGENEFTPENLKSFNCPPKNPDDNNRCDPAKFYEVTIIDLGLAVPIYVYESTQAVSPKALTEEKRDSLDPKTLHMLDDGKGAWNGDAATTTADIFFRVNGTLRLPGSNSPTDNEVDETGTDDKVGSISSSTSSTDSDLGKGLRAVVYLTSKVGAQGSRVRAPEEVAEHIPFTTWPMYADGTFIASDRVSVHKKMRMFAPHAHTHACSSFRLTRSSFSHPHL